MNDKLSRAWKVLGLAGMLAGVLTWPGIGYAQSIAGQASAVTAVILGNVTSLANTGTLTSASDPLGTGQPTGSIPGLLGAEALHAVTMGWTDQVYSESSLANLGLNVAGIGITANTVLSRALATASGSIGQGRVEGLSIGGVPITVTGAPNQALSLLGLSVILNEQTQSAGGIIVNAMRVRTLNGLTDVVVGSARAGI
jgi:hypothetical protein